MAMTYLEKMKQNQSQQTPQQGLRGVSENTQTQMAKYQNGYQPTEKVQQAQQNLQTMQQQKPQSYSSKWSGALDNILQQIQKPGTFKYDMNGDALFNSYKDLVSEQARQGAVNAQGMAAGLTGGYGNSYAQSAGAQAYQQALLPLYERIPDFANLARQNYDADINNRYRALGALQDAENAEYDRYRKDDSGKPLMPEYDETTEPDTKLLVPAPYDNIYTYWLMSKIDEQTMEQEKFNNDRQMFNASWESFSDYWTRNHMPITRVRELRL